MESSDYKNVNDTSLLEDAFLHFVAFVSYSCHLLRKGLKAMAFGREVFRFRAQTRYGRALLTRNKPSGLDRILIE